MTALATEVITVDLDQALWQMWQSMDVPEGFHAEIIEGVIEVSPTGGSRHAQVNRRLARALHDFLRGSGFGPAQDFNVIHGFKVLIPDVFVAPDETEEIEHPEGLGVLTSGVGLVVETVSPGSDARQRDLVRKHRAYAQAGIPVYVIIDDYDTGGAVTVLSGPDPKRGAYARSVRTPYGEEALVPEGPAKGFVIGPEITGGPLDQQA
ncbi:Uma2 family endonuclease [Kitasatospora sp. NBC_01287]|uniref:Uma2 family endonuclease n=1 Tax=Kitasatospora sp. NBC_01287 TaxID=2903573 RepID=UPI00224D1941|nr:Uma2 family endonuclease [Kitasatospora sp. NBC_01287]MCX4747813.1 Uma2 family endonuclease [Kitasatospora sp. NBC_01287]